MSGSIHKTGYVKLDESTKNLIGMYNSVDLRASKVDAFHSDWEDQKKKTYFMPEK